LTRLPGFLLEVAMDERKKILDFDEERYECYRKTDKQDIPGFLHTTASMKFGTSEASRRSTERSQLLAMFNNKDIAGKLHECLYSGRKDTVKALYEAINQTFQGEVIKYNWISFKAAAKELGVSVDVVRIFLRNGLLRSIMVGGREKINGADVKRVYYIKKDFPEEFKPVKESATQQLEGYRAGSRMSCLPDKVICKRNNHGKVPVSKQGNVYQISLTEPGFPSLY
jgi:hypothetical protein